MGDASDPAADEFDETADEGRGPERKCAVTGKVKPKAELLRFVLSPDGEVMSDIGMKLPGRGIWLSARRDVVNTAVVKRLFARAARRAAIVPADLADRVDAALARRCLDTLGLARRAGQAVCGFEKVKAEVKGRRVAVLVAASDAAPDGRDRMRALATGLPVVELFDGTQLGAVFGRDVAVHVAIAPGGLASRLLAEASRLADYRSPEGGPKD